MPPQGLNEYGVWVAKPVSFTAETHEQDPDSPHIHLIYDDGKSSTLKAAINIKSKSKESRLVFWIYPDFKHPMLDDLQGLSPGFHDLKGNRELSLDYIRSNILQLREGSLLDHDIPGPGNDMIDYFTPILNNAIASEATVYLFGEPFRGKDGIHDVHMNQGNEGKFAQYNGVYQDGGLIFGFPDGHFEAVFLAFGVQKYHTNDETGQPIGDADFASLYKKKSGPQQPPPPQNGEAPSPATPSGDDDDAQVVIQAALVNPSGPDGQRGVSGESVTLYNRSANSISLASWGVGNGKGATQSLSGSLVGMSKRTFAVPGAPLSNKGGTITLLDSNGLKVHGVRYTRDEARRQGQFLFFN
ncbi:hypothetical protein Micbo1qcDRAFT_208684 [Microdochium bolleyi]|uniref:LTD domain-containing protein n=1 Tax=Microdochium bolleyi TaxID=196109 RepID=A0A136IPQ2_9PEZI|nr:hypothetical protein Micbo1qcDRAFT_208684 [Microdochium bolleyi]